MMPQALYIFNSRRKANGKENTVNNKEDDSCRVLYGTPDSGACQDL